MGEFDLENFSNNSDHVLVYILWLANTFLILVVFLNLLIAIISDIFDKVHENIKTNLVKELVYFMVESEVLINRKKLFKKQKYMIIVARVKGETADFSADSKMEIIKHNMNLQVQLQKAELDQIQHNLESELKERIYMRSNAIEGSACKQLGKYSFKITQDTNSMNTDMLADRIEETETLHNKYKVLFDTLQRLEV